MARTVVEFGPGELLVVGGDYGEMVLSSPFKNVCDTLDAVVTSTRLSGGRPRISVVVEYDDAAAPFIEDRHAGREGTPESGVPSDAERVDTSGAESLVTPEPAGGQADRRP